MSIEIFIINRKKGGQNVGLVWKKIYIKGNLIVFNSEFTLFCIHYNIEQF
jgi:hypothetical protein